MANLRTSTATAHHQNHHRLPMEQPLASDQAGNQPELKSHHHHHQGQPSTSPQANTKAFRNHQRRQSVARLLPDISKLRLLSWLVEASNELINCNIAIMDSVYAKLNKSQESLLFWNSLTAKQPAANQLRPPPAPNSQPVANNKQLALISQQQHLRKQLRKQEKLKLVAAAARNHHSLPLTNYDASSMAAVSFISTSTANSLPKTSKSIQQKLRQQQRKASLGSNKQREANVCSPANRQQQSQELTTNTTCDSASLTPSATATIKIDNSISDSNQSDLDDELEVDGDQADGDDDDDDDHSSAASSTTSSGHASSSISSSVSSASSSDNNNNISQQQQQQQPIYVSSAEQLSEKIRRIVMEHNYLQNLLVNIIRQHDKQRLELNRQRVRRQQASFQANQHQYSSLDSSGSSGNQHNLSQQVQKIDLADIADALDDGCFCLCHSEEQHQLRALEDQSQLLIGKIPSHGKALTLPATINTSITTTTTTASSSQQQDNAAGQTANQQQPRKARRLKKFRKNNSNNSCLTKKDLLDLLPGKLCSNCFETHYWLYGSASDSPYDLHSPKQSINLESLDDIDQLNDYISKRNATFIKLVQQEVRSTISKSIELIDLIRKEIKSPESIKQKQLMRCFSTSIQLLTSVGNYVVPSQDISSFIQPEFFQDHQLGSPSSSSSTAAAASTALFSLPSSDFDHLFLYPSISSNHHLRANQLSNYHLAPAPEIPIRRKINQLQQLELDNKKLTVDSDPDNRSSKSSPAVNRKLLPSNKSSSLKHQTTTNDTKDSSDILINASAAATAVESSSGNSSNNSSASSSIARGAVQQSSLTRAHTSSAILDGKTSHDLSYDAIANLSHHHQSAHPAVHHDDHLMLSFQTKPKFWQASKFNFIKKLLHVKEQRLLRQQSKDRRIYNNKVQNKFRLVMMDLTHFNKSQQLLTTENGVNSLLTSMRNVLEFGLYLTLKLY